SKLDRRRFLTAMGAGGLFFTVRGAFAQQLVLTPAQTPGPYYPDRLPLDVDNDLLIINDTITPAVGEVAWVYGRILDRNGQPVRGALVEIWQADTNGAYIHSASSIANRDRNFQGYGKFLTGSSGDYLFRTVKPGLYPGRTRHIHYAVTPPGATRFTTQLYVEGDPLNTSDGVLNEIRDTAARASVIRPFTQVPGSRVGELAARFDIVMGFTPTGNAAPARPTLVSMYAVVNGASFYPGAAAGSWVTLFGNNLAAASRTWGAPDIVNGALPFTLDGVSVRVNNQPAPVSYVSPRQINVQAPAASTAGSVQVTVTNASGASDPVTVELKPFMPSFFLLPQEYVAAVRSDGAFLGPAALIDGVTTVPAKPGDQVILFGTGFGPTNPEVPAGRVFEGAAALATPATIRIDGVAVNVSFAGLSGVGLYQFNLTVPELTDGDHAVTADAGGARTEKIARIRVQRQLSGGNSAPARTQLAAADLYRQLMSLVQGDAGFAGVSRT
ncbi:MAG: IPT/TIG domain-containing protein, partial [Bryobacteraceae bacterium]